MKQCPTCHSQYTDDTLQFCLQDGTPLQSAAASGEQETVVSGRPSSQINTPAATNPTGWSPDQYSRPAEKKSNATMAVFLTVFIMLLIFSFVGIGVWLYYRGVTPDDNGNLFIAKRRTDSDTMSNTNTASKTTPMATTTPLTATNANTVVNSTPVDKEQIRRDVSQRVNSWKSGTESRDVNSYINLYADTLDYYYNKRNVSRSSIRSDKQNAFNQYSDIQINLSNLNITPDSSGEKATAVFDKEWIFNGTKRFAGKAQSQLQFKKVNGQWLITGERDLKVYYTE
jgi:hypothetical protein